MMKGIQLKEEMSTWLWDLPNYFKIKENPDYEEKLINLMLNGLRLFKNSSLNEITLFEDEEILHKTVMDFLYF